MESDSEDSGSDLSISDSSSSDSDGDNDDRTIIGPLWTVQDPDNFQFTHRIQPFVLRTGAVNPPPKHAEPIDYFKWLLCCGDSNNSKIMSILVEETNRYARQMLTNTIRPHSRMNKWEDVTEDEMSAFIGLWLSMGIIRKPTMASYWETNKKTLLLNTPAFSKVMRRDRFQLILKCLHANDNERSVPRGRRNISQVNSIHGMGYDVVTKLVEPFYGKFHHVTTDNAFSSPALSEKLVQNDTYSTGTVRNGRKGMPKSFRRTKLAKGESMVRQPVR
ncbi:hypothetical protein KUTeg_018778 [Tegillarca granosa]|uniref:PiggyBac transposable element-derived protein domain-containing protein n=1 Tax=Tegillarca granosa TaxID=220873 RepID=A0ABQ9EEC8_TEGGR|nr:hypothetical protein KUTeg_018778 [Tegillarca granosa]